MSKAPIIRWGADTAQARGPVVAGLDAGEHRNAIGVHAGAFSVYQALAVATGALSIHHRPDLTGTAPPAALGPFPQWSEPGRIVTMDPWAIGWVTCSPPSAPRAWTSARASLSRRATF